MPKCEGCGVELLEGTVFCPYCGAQVKKDEPANPEFVEVEKEQEQAGFDDQVLNTYGPKKESKAFKVFATLGMIFGIVSLSFILLTLLCSGLPEEAWLVACAGFEFAIPGFVFSIIGKKSTLYRGKATFGFVANLIAMIVLFILAVALLLIAMLEGGYDPSYGIYY